MEIIDKALEFETRKLSFQTTSDRIVASREVKALILGVNEIYKENKAIFTQKDYLFKDCPKVLKVGRYHTKHCTLSMVWAFNWHSKYSILSTT